MYRTIEKCFSYEGNPSMRRIGLCPVSERPARVTEFNWIMYFFIFNSVIILEVFRMSKTIQEWNQIFRFYYSHITCETGHARGIFFTYDLVIAKVYSLWHDLFLFSPPKLLTKVSKIRNIMYLNKAGTVVHRAMFTKHF